MKYIPTKMENPLLVPSIISIHYFEYSVDFRYCGEAHDFWELIVCDKGELCITAGDRDLVLTKGQAFLHPPMQFHNVRAYGDDAPNSVIISFESPTAELYSIADKVLNTDSYVATALFSVLNEAGKSFGNKLGSVVEPRLIRNQRPAPFASEQIIQNYTELLLIHLIRNEMEPSADAQLPTNVKRNDMCERIVRYMEENLSEKMTFADILKRFSISSTSLKKLFGSAYGHGVIEHLTELRIERAKQLLREENKSCTEIATMCGFCSVHHFSNTFRKQEGMPPTEYVKTIKSLLEVAEK